MTHTNKAITIYPQNAKNVFSVLSNPLHDGRRLLLGKVSDFLANRIVLF